MEALFSFTVMPGDTRLDVIDIERGKLRGKPLYIWPNVHEGLFLTAIKDLNPGVEVIIPIKQWREKEDDLEDLRKKVHGYVDRVIDAAKTVSQTGEGAE